MQTAVLKEQILTQAKPTQIYPKYPVLGLKAHLADSVTVTQSLAWAYTSPSVLQQHVMLISVHHFGNTNSCLCTYRTECAASSWQV